MIKQKRMRAMIVKTDRQKDRFTKRGEKNGEEGECLEEETDNM